MKLFLILVLAAIAYSANGATLNKRDVRDDLLTKATALEKQANSAIKSLVNTGRSAVAAELEREEKVLQRLATELKAATGEQALRRLETEVKSAENRLATELRRIEGRSSRPSSSPSTTTVASIVKRDVRDDVLAKAEAVEKNATAEIEKLKAQGRTMAVAALQRDETRLQHVATELKAATSEATIRRLEAEVRAIEMRIQEEIRRDERTTGSERAQRTTKSAQSTASTAASIVKRDAKDDVLAKAANVEKNIATEEKKLRAEGRTGAAASLEREGKRLQTLVTELKATTAESTVTRIENEIKALETRIQDEIKRDERVSVTTSGSTRPSGSTRTRGTTRAPTTAGTTNASSS